MFSTFVHVGAHVYLYIYTCNRIERTFVTCQSSQVENWTALDCHTNMFTSRNLSDYIKKNEKYRADFDFGKNDLEADRNKFKARRDGRMPPEHQSPKKESKEESGDSVDSDGESSSTESEAS